MNRLPEETPAFTHMVKVGHISHNPFELHLEAGDRERAELAKLWKVVSVDALSADLKIRRWKKDGIRIFGEIAGRVTQNCVVTLEPLENDIAEEIDQIFVPEGSALARIPANDHGEVIVDPDGPDLPETFVGDAIDVGAVVAEFAAMGIDPYPRKPGVAFSAHIEQPAEEDRKPSPFAVFKNLKVEN
jgi:uncharacterized metal-binding protein YceD (DUF177 family)